jgi:hypothetical protein
MPAMQNRTPKSLSWSEVLAALRSGAGVAVVIRDGNVTAPVVAVRSRPAAKGTELCLFSGEGSATRLDLVERLDALSKGAGRRFMTSARASINESVLLIESVADENVDDAFVTVLNTCRPTLGYNQSQQTGDSSTLRSKRIKTGS